MKTYICWQCDESFTDKKKSFIIMNKIKVSKRTIWFKLFPGRDKIILEMYNKDGYSFCSLECFKRFLNIFNVI